MSLFSRFTMLHADCFSCFRGLGDSFRIPAMNPEILEFSWEVWVPSSQVRACMASEAASSDKLHRESVYARL